MTARNYRAYVSAYDRARIHMTRMYAYEKCRLVADFNGALEPDEAIASATWQVQYTNSLVMADPTATTRQTSILVGSQYSGPTVIKCTVTLTDGQLRVQQFRIDVLAQPVYQGDQWVNGPLSLTATV
jgi:hypothetical protein